MKNSVPTKTPMDESPPLIISSDPHFLRHAHNWCAALGKSATEYRPSASFGRQWQTADFVLIDAEAAHLIAAKQVARRTNVFLIGEPSIDNLKSAVAVGATQVIRFDGNDVVTVLAEAVEGTGEACVISVMGACGGVGASTLATALACATARQQRSVVLVDGDHTSGGIELVLGAERAEGLRWADLEATTGHITVPELREALPSRHGVDVLSFGRGAQDVVSGSSVVSTLVRGYDAVIADVPRRLDALSSELVNRSVAIVLVVPLRLSGVVAAERLLPQLTDGGAQVLVVARAAPGGLDRRELAARLGVPVIDHMPTQRRIFADVEHGLGPRRGAPLRVSSTILEMVGLS
ncbi:MAG: hypothetical protein E6Q27_09200 [Aeromicrobium sp.]|nr:MAG: hypothetical protein E6Q27_09200 [Aeromicrobium sp.]